MEQEAGVGLLQHRRVVERVAGGHHPVVQALEGRHGGLLLLRDPDPVAGDPVLLHDQPVAQERRPAELAQERLRKLFEGVGEDHHLEALPQRVEELPASGQRLQGRDHRLQIRKAQAVLVEDPQPPAHQHVVIGFIAGRPAQLGDAGLLRDGDPDFRHEHPFKVQDGKRLFHPGGWSNFSGHVEKMPGAGAAPGSPRAEGLTASP